MSLTVQNELGSGGTRAKVKHEFKYWRLSDSLFLSVVSGADCFPLWSDDKSEHAQIPADPLLHG